MEIREYGFMGKPLDIHVIDAHTHILGYYYLGWYQSCKDNNAVIALMDHLGVNCIVTAPHSMIMGNMSDTNEIAMHTAAQFPGRIYGYITVRPQMGLQGVREMLEKYSQIESFVGIKLLAGYHGGLNCPEYDYVMDFAQDAGCPVLSHIWEGNPTFGDVERSVKSRPHLKLMMAHQGGGNEKCTLEYSKLMEQYPGLYMEICGSMFNQYTIEEIVELAGDERIIYGTDMVNLDPRYEFGRVVFSTLPDRVKSKIMADNFLKLLDGSRLGKINLSA